MPTINLGIIAHVDAGKTSLTERLLYQAGVIGKVGRVDHGDTRTDTLELERERGITIKSAVTSFVLTDVAQTERRTDRRDPVTVNLIDTPGHPDFIAEVERVLDVLDGIVLVVSAVEGVQAQTRILTRVIRRLRLPTLIFVNKIDRAGAEPDRVLTDLHRLLGLTVIGMGRAIGAGTRAAGFDPFTSSDPGFRERLVDLVTANDDELLAHYVDAGRLDADTTDRALADQTARAVIQPAFLGSAITGAGVAELLTGIGRLLPARDDQGSGPPTGVIFKIDRGPAGEKIAYLRMITGSLGVRDQVLVSSGRRPFRVTALHVFSQAREERVAQVRGGMIAKVWGLGGARIGDRLSPVDGTGPVHSAGPINSTGSIDSTGSAEHHEHYFTPPSLETVVAPVDPANGSKLRTALDQLAEQDPLINVRQDQVRAELSVSLYGEVQKEVIGATLESDFGVAVRFAQTSTICVERPTGTGSAVEFIGQDGNPFLATLGLRLEPGRPGSGITFGMETAVHGTMPVAFVKAVEETVRRTAAEALHGWQLIDAVITVTHTGYAPRQSHMHQGFNKAMSSTGADFRDLTPLVLMAALREAGTAVLEPIHHFTLEFPSDLIATIYPVLADRRAIPGTPEVVGRVTRIEGDLPAAEIHTLEQSLPGLTRGEGVVETSFDRYEPVVGHPPERPRTDRNPLDRREYLLRCSREKGALS